MGGPSAAAASRCGQLLVPVGETEIGLLWGGGVQEPAQSSLSQLLSNYTADHHLCAIQHTAFVGLRERYRGDGLDASIMVLIIMPDYRFAV